MAKKPVRPASMPEPNPVYVPRPTNRDPCPTGGPGFN